MSLSTAEFSRDFADLPRLYVAGVDSLVRGDVLLPKIHVGKIQCDYANNGD